MENKKLENMSVTLQDILQAEKNIKDKIVRTQLLKADHLSDENNAEIYIKPENMQRVRSFKIRGALNKVYSLTKEQKANGVIAPSAGNHAQGVALASTLAGVKSYIVMPKTAPLEKINATKGFGGEVILADGTTFDDACALAEKMSKEKHLTFLHAFNDKEVIAGQGTIGLEILRDLPDVDMVITPIGGGGLAAGLGVALKSINPRIQIIGVEAESFQCMKHAIEVNKIEAIVPPHPTLADGTAVKIVGDKTFELCHKFLDKIVTVSEEQIEDAITFALQKCKLTVEGAGALSLAAIINNKIPNIKGKKVVCLITGGNIDIDKLLLSVEHSLTRQNRRISFLIKNEENILSNLVSVLKNNSCVAYDLVGNNINDVYKLNKESLVINVYNPIPLNRDKIIKELEDKKINFTIIK